MQAELLEWNFWHVQSNEWPGFSVRAGLGRKFVKIFQVDFGPAYKTFLWH